MKTDKGEIFKRIMEIVNFYDPMDLIKIGCPEDEYCPEVDMIIDWIDNCKSEEDFSIWMFQMFNKMFHGIVDKDLIWFKHPAGEIWEFWKENS